MDIKKIILFSFLLFAVVGFALAPASAATKIVKFKDNPTWGNSVKIGKGDNLDAFYTSKYSYQEGKSRPVVISIWGSHGPWGKYHYITKAKVTYKKPNGKYVTKSYKPTKKHYAINKQAPKGWKPIKAKIYYVTTKKSILWLII